MIITDYELIKSGCLEDQERFQPGLEEKPELSGRGFLMTVMTVNHNCMYMHWHNYFEIVLFTGGEGVCFIDGKRYPVSEGDIAVINSGQVHAAYSVNHTVMSFTPIIFDKSVFASYPYDSYFNGFMVPFMEGKLVLSGIIRKENSQYDSICSIIEDLRSEFDKKEQGYQLCIRSYLQILIVKIGKAFGFEERKTEKNQILLTHDFKKLFDYVETNYSEKITLEQAAETVNLSVYHFCKVFKEMTGLTFVKFLNLHRVNAAEELLGSTGFSITEISEKTGFCNINYFCRIFKQFKGYTPSGYRIGNRQNPKNGVNLKLYKNTGGAT